MSILLYNVIGLDDLEGVSFARCSTYEKAEKAKKILEEEGFENMLEIVKDEVPIDTIVVGDEIITL